MQNVDTTKYVIYADITAEGIVERPDVVGAIFGQTEGLLGSDLDLRDLQKTGRLGRIDVQITSSGGKSGGSSQISLTPSFCSRCRINCSEDSSISARLAQPYSCGCWRAKVKR